MRGGLRCPEVWKSLHRDLPGQTHRFCKEKQRREPKPSKKREVVQGTSASPDQTPALAAGLLRRHWESSRREQNLSGKGKAPAKGILPLVSIKQGGISQWGGGFSPFLGGVGVLGPTEKQGWAGGREGKASRKINSHPPSRDNSHPGPPAPISKLCWWGAAQVGRGSPSPLCPHPAGSESFFSSLQAAWLRRRLARSCLPHALIARAAGLEPTSLLSCTAPSVNDEKRKGWELLSLSLAPDSLPYIIQE